MVDEPRVVGVGASTVDTTTWSAGAIGNFATLAGAIHDGRAVGRSFSKGDVIDRYEILDFVGRGGFSDVYRVRHRYLEQQFALKTLSQASGREQGERFLREARTLALLAHPSVVRVYDANISSDGVPFIIMELLSGSTLDSKSRSAAVMSPERVTDLLEEVTQVLVLQERLGVIHRDIKPSNIIERAGGAFCLLDYTSVGIPQHGRMHDAFETATDLTRSNGPALGTPLYMAPEQFRGAATHQSDLFGLGMTAWQCLAGKPPRSPALSLAELAARADDFIPDAFAEGRAPRPISTMLKHLLEPDLAKRYQTASELLADIQDYRYQGKQPTGPLKGNCFVAIPYRADFMSVYDAILRASANSHLRPRRMDEITFVSDIWSRIEQEIASAKVVIADFTRMGWVQQTNPNVVTEAAHARAIGRPLIIITRDRPETLPFDWRHMPVLRYRDTQEGLAELAKTLESRLDLLMRDSR